MSLVVAFDEINADKVKHRRKPGNPGTTSTPFFRSTVDTPGPAAYVNRYDPGRHSSAHYHENDQFQIIIDGKGEFGRHHVSPYCVHFSRAYTSYGPLDADEQTGWAFLVLRSRYDPGAQRNASEKLVQVPNRRPWQVTKQIAIPARSTGVNIQEDPEIKDEQGLFVRPLSMGPHTSTTAPDPSSGDGQFLVVFKGSLIHENSERKALAVVFVKPVETAFRIQAGAQGLEGAIFNLPKVQARALKSNTPSVAAGFKKWQCMLCSFAYDEALGMPDEGIPAGYALGGCARQLELPGLLSEQKRLSDGRGIGYTIDSRLTVFAKLSAFGSSKLLGGWPKVNKWPDNKRGGVEIALRCGLNCSKGNHEFPVVAEHCP